MKSVLRSCLCLVLLIIFSASTFAANETQAGNKTGENISEASLPAATPPKAAAARNTTRAAQRPAANQETNCGNGKIDPGETCYSCAQDVKCKKGQMCNASTEGCETVANFTLYIILGVGIFALLALFFVAKRLAKKPEEPIQKQGFMQQKPASEKPAEQKAEPVQQAPPAQKPIEQQPSPAAKAEIQTPLETQAQPEAQEKTERGEEHSGERDVQRFIRQRRESGWTDEQIRKNMKDAGWKDTQIALEFLKAPKRSARR